jgi:hypothetical protein
VAVFSSLFGNPLTGLLTPLEFGPPVEGYFQVFAGEFRGGVALAVGDLDGDGDAEIVCAAGPGGGPHVRVLDLVRNSNGTLSLADRGSFFAYDQHFTGGLSVAVADFTGDGFGDIVTGALNGAAHVKVFDGKTLQEVKAFYAFDLTFVGGVYVTAADLDGDHRAEIIVGAADGGGPHVRVFKDIATVTVPFDGGPYGVVRIADFFADDGNLRGGVRVAARDLDGDGLPEVVTTAAGGGSGSADRVRVFDPTPFAAPVTEPVNRPPDLTPIQGFPTQVFFPLDLADRGARDFQEGFFLDGGSLAVANAVALIDPRARVQVIRRNAVGDKFTISLFPEEDTAAVLRQPAVIGFGNFSVMLSTSIHNSSESFVDVRLAPGDARPTVGVSFRDADGGSSFYFFRLLAETLSIAEGVEFEDPFPFTFQSAVFPDTAGVEGLSRQPGPANLVPTRGLAGSERDRDRVFAEIGVTSDGAFVG